MNDGTTMIWSDDREPLPDVPGFDFIREIGQGGFGRVWLARNQTTRGLLAVKVIPFHSSGPRDPAGREISALSVLEEIRRLHHPDLLCIHHVGETQTLDRRYLYYTMDLADDVSDSSAPADLAYQPATLKRRLDQGPLDPEHCLRCARQLLGGLAFLHEKGMVHRDVKPGNCLFVAGELKLADFGLLTRSDRQLSRVGTLRYMPPDGRMDARADVYAAGLVIYEMMTAWPADSFPHLGEMAGKIAENPILATLNRLALRACYANRSQRFEDARKMLDSMEAWIRPGPTRRRAASVGLAALFVIGLGGFGIWLSQPSRVHVNFITEPYGARVLLDDKVLKDPTTGIECATPCSVPNLSAKPHHVVFQRDGSADFDVGQIDFATTREIIAQMQSGADSEEPPGAIAAGDTQE
ncbi:MAG TPA: protein kinase [Thermoguttaceae bacterium]|nr:protein kinase [Thermoguttaceae bacterium]